MCEKEDEERGGWGLGLGERALAAAGARGEIRSPFPGRGPHRPHLRMIPAWRGPEGDRARVPAPESVALQWLGPRTA